MLWSSIVAQYNRPLHIIQNSFITFRMRRVAAFVELMHILHTQHNITDPKDFYYGSFSNNIMSALLSTLHKKIQNTHMHGFYSEPVSWKILKNIPWNILKIYKGFISISGSVWNCMYHKKNHMKIKDKFRNLSQNRTKLL